MWWLTDERGATAVFTAVSLVALIGMAAFAIDAGALYAERRELQNGADAAALAVAEDCLDDGLPCSYGAAQVTAEKYADANASDDAALVHDIALNVTGKTVTVTVRSEDEAGETVMAPFFAQVIGFGGTEVQAAATAEWGFPWGYPAPPLIISDCEFDPDNAELGERFIFYFHDGKSEEPCHDSGSGFDLPGGFGWLDKGAEYDCAIYLETNSEYLADPGASPSTGCSPKTLKQVLMPNWDSEGGQDATVLPYFNKCTTDSGEDCTDGVGGVGNLIWYEVVGYGGFHVLGYNFGGLYKEPLTQDLTVDSFFRPAGSLPCTGDERCIAGYYTDVTIYDGDLGGTDRGVTLVKLTN